MTATYRVPILTAALVVSTSRFRAWITQGDVRGIWYGRRPIEMSVVHLADGEIERLFGGSLVGLFTTASAARELRIGRSRVAWLCAEGLIRAHRIPAGGGLNPGDWRIRADEMTRLLNERMASM